MIYNGIKLIVNNGVCMKPIREFFNYPKTRKKRIIKKWKKLDKNWRDKKNAYNHSSFYIKDKNTMIVSTETLRKLKKITAEPKKEVYNMPASTPFMSFGANFGIPSLTRYSITS